VRESDGVLAVVESGNGRLIMVLVLSCSDKAGQGSAQWRPARRGRNRINRRSDWDDFLVWTDKWADGSMHIETAFSESSRWIQWLHFFLFFFYFFHSTLQPGVRDAFSVFYIQ
jgi:hypothetical protein